MGKKKKKRNKNDSKDDKQNSNQNSDESKSKASEEELKQDLLFSLESIKRSQFLTELSLITVLIGMYSLRIQEDHTLRRLDGEEIEDTLELDEISIFNGTIVLYVSVIFLFNRLRILNYVKSSPNIYTELDIQIANNEYLAAVLALLAVILNTIDTGLQYQEDLASNTTVDQFQNLTFNF